MCLNEITSTDKKYLKRFEDKIGYKVFRLDFKDKLFNPYFDVHVHRPKRKWIHDIRIANIQMCYYTDKYPCGFHIYTNKKMALDKKLSNLGVRVVYKIRYKNVVAYGKDFNNANCVVAKSMIILSEVKEK